MGFSRVEDWDFPGMRGFFRGKDRNYLEMRGGFPARVGLWAKQSAGIGVIGLQRKFSGKVGRILPYIR